MQEVLYLTYTEIFYFWILLPGREIYRPGLPEAFATNACNTSEVRQDGIR
jgi:hypothetical protein